MNLNKLRGRIVEAGLTQDDLAKACGISRSTLSRKITGQQPFNTSEINHICDALKIEDNAEKAEIFLGWPS